MNKQWMDEGVYDTPLPDDNYVIKLVPVSKREEPYSKFDRFE